MDDLLTTRQLQAILHVDRVTIYRMLGDGRLTGFKVGGQWRFPRREIESWLRQQQDASSPVDSAATAGGNDRESLTSPALPVTCVQAIQSIYAEALGVAAVTLEAEGAPLTQVSNSCEFCNLILATELGYQNCAASWLAASQARLGDPLFSSCHAGLLVTAAPVQIGEQCVASAISCQFTTQPASTRPTQWQAGLPRLATSLGLPLGALEAASASIRVVPESQLPRISHLVEKVAGAFSKIGQERLELVSRLRRIAEITNL